MRPFGQHLGLLGRSIELDVIHAGIALTGLHTAFTLLFAIVWSTWSRIELGHLFRSGKRIGNVIVAEHKSGHGPLLQPLVT